MTRILLISTFFLCYGLLEAQDTWVKMDRDTFIYAFNSDWELIEPHEAATYYRKAWPLNEDIFYVFDYYKNGNIQMKSTARNHNPQFNEEYVSGLIRYTIDGDTLSYVKYNDTSALHGKSKAFYESGQIKSIGEYFDGLYNGPWSTYHENGQLKSHGTYERGNKTGTWKYFHENGALEVEGTYDKDGPSGEWLYNYPNGYTHKRLNYIQGNVVGEVITFDSLGKKRSVYHYDNDGKIHGTVEKYDEGVLIYSATYKHGDLSKEEYEGERIRDKDYVSLYKESRQRLLTRTVDSKALDKHLTGYVSNQKDGWASDRAVIHYCVDEFGQLKDVKVLETCNDLIDSALINGLTSFQWSPSTVGGKPVRACNEIVVNLNYSAVEEIHFGDRFIDQDLAEITGRDKADNIDDKVSNEVFRMVEVQPEFPGGLEGLMKFLQENTKYPKSAKDANIQGLVYIEFVVGRSGIVHSPEVIRGVHPTLDNEGMRVVKEMPKWRPGMQRGELVSVFYKLPFRFNLR